MKHRKSTVTDQFSIAVGEGVLTISGTITVATIGSIERTLAPNPLDDITVIDGSEITALDTAGALYISGINQGAVELRGFGEDKIRLIDMSRVTPIESASQLKTKQPMTLEYFGGLVLKGVEGIDEIAVLIVDILYWSVRGLFDRKQFRKGSFAEQAYYMGSSALPIIATILFLIGAISALQSSSTLRSFGASIFVVDMLAVGLAREMAPLMTAIIISGRSGSAIASEIATMKFTEELDAIKTMGLNPLRFIIVPKLWAMVVCMPMLTIMALGFGLLGGFFVAITYIQLTPQTFFNRLVISLFFWDVTTGLIKSVSFAVIITIVGTYRGMTFTGGADGVGRSTTSSVVTSIFAIIVMDAIWGIIFYFH